MNGRLNEEIGYIQMTDWRVKIVTYNVAMKSGDVGSAEEIVKSEGDEELLIIGLQVSVYFVNSLRVCRRQC